jgi:hypothetical protein
VTVAVIAIVLVVLIALTAPGGSSPTQAGAPARTNPNAPLASQLSQLDRAINQSHR